MKIREYEARCISTPGAISMPDPWACTWEHLCLADATLAALR